MSKLSLNEKRQKNSNLYDSNRSSSTKQKKSDKLDVFLKKELGTRFLFLYVYGINTQDLRSLIKTLKLPIIVTGEIQYADAILALGNLMKNNKKLRQLSSSRNICVYTIQNNGLIQISKALKQIVKQSLNLEFNEKRMRIKNVGSFLLTPLEEVRLAIEEIVISDKCIVDLLPRTKSIRRLQNEVIDHYHLDSSPIGEGSNKRIRIYP